MSSLVEHARRELEIIGEEQETVDGILKVIQAAADMHMSGGQAEVVVPIIYQLLSRQPLSPVTDDPEEWAYFGDDIWKGGVWQNIRDSQCFSHDGGKTYWRLNNYEAATAHVSRYESKHKEKTT